MGASYDIGVLRGVTLAQMGEALGRSVLGPEVSRPWESVSGVSLAQIDTAAGSHVVVVSPPHELPSETGEGLARTLGAEGLFATMWDIVSTYHLNVVGEGIDRWLSSEPQAFGEGHRDSRGEPLPEEPGRPDLDQALIQAVLTGRCGVDPARLRTCGATWYAFES